MQHSGLANPADERRQASPPSQTADVPDSNVIVSFNGVEMANAPKPANAAAGSDIFNQQSMDGPAEQFRATERAYGGREAY